MNSLVNLKNTCEDFEVEFEIIPCDENSTSIDSRRIEIQDGLNDIDIRFDEINKLVAELNSEIDRLTNQADGIDYMVAVGSGIIAGLIDIIFVGEFSLEKANEWGDEKANNIVVKMAQKKGYEGEDLYGAVKHLEKEFPIAADKATNAFGGGLQHHLRDFSHHPTIVGLFFSFLTQFTRKAYGTDTAGIFKIVELQEDDFVLIGKNFPEKITFGVVNWIFHLISDMAGSSSSVLQGKVGTGIPGPIVSFLKEISVLPIFKSMNKDGYKEFSVWISKLFNGTLLGQRDENGKLIPLKFDLRTEMGIAHQLKQQAIPVIINECIVRGFYFIRRLCIELKQNQIRSIHDLKNINWKNTLPFKNRTVIRMLTISTGTFTAMDLADAAIHSAIKSGGINPVFLSNMLLRVNFVGVGRFAIAVGTDVGMGIKKGAKQNQRMALYSEMLNLSNAKVFYKQADMWISAETTEKTINDAYNKIEETTIFFIESYEANRKSLENIGSFKDGIDENNETLVDEITEILKWG